MKKLLIALLALTSVAHAESITHGGTTINMDFVDIGYAGNTADTSGYGAVDYDYRMGKYEVTIDQFAQARMADNRIGSGNEVYWNSLPRTVGTAGPACGVTWYESATFANWLTTGDAYTGAYQFSSSGTLLDIDRSYRNSSGIAYVLPTEDEWYKAAYYKPIDSGSYSLYASGLDALPISGTTDGWNFRNESGQLVNSYPDVMWEVGYGAEEQNGTYDMMGNVWEWTESIYSQILNDWRNHRVIRGGCADNSGVIMSSSVRTYFSRTTQDVYTGFRVVAVPEANSALLIALVGGLGLFVRRHFPSV